eukprot:TRINITY_DN78831_c0_g1_i1.p4 TRINITY_DN78831_c0_g1~~TRINITY_DN78831_c0_g1_i1.p4  ORF type:complete len:111 (-),score=10.21 TRINITY_DN78831_c0_g1_i1:61-393(-)
MKNRIDKMIISDWIIVPVQNGMAGIMSESPVRQMRRQAADMRPEGGVVLWGDEDFELIDQRYSELYGHLKAKAPPGQMPGRRERRPVQILVQVANIQMRTLKAKVEKGSI